MNDERPEAVYRHTHLLGTRIDIRVRADDPDALPIADRSIVDEIVRLEAVFSVYDDDSELNRWKRDEVREPSEELIAVMSAALDWQVRSNGAFNPMSGALSDVWRRAEQDGRLPSPRELHDVATSITEHRYTCDDGTIIRIGDCTTLNLNAIAKGFIVDRACALTMQRGDVAMVMLSAGGDLVHRGEPSVQVGIANPLRPYDNEPPAAVIEFGGAGLATSGGSRRGFRIGGERFSHVIDPRTGAPVRGQASISVVAPDAMTADALSTTLGMSEPAEVVEASESYVGCACLAIGEDGSRWPNTQWLHAYGDPGSATTASTPPSRR